MRTIIKLTGFICVASLLSVISCSDSERSNELSPAVKQYLYMRIGANTAMAESMTGPITQSFRTLFNSGVANGRFSDTTLLDNYWTCAVVSQIKHDDGRTTIVYDYGDGCEEDWGDYKYFMHGKYSSTYRNIESSNGAEIKTSYLYSSEYDNYGGTYNNQNTWLMNGFGSYRGESEYDTVSQEFTGAYSYENETTYQYDSIQYYYKNKGATRYSNQKYIIESSETNYTYGNDYYKSIVLRPLVADYACNSNLLYGAKGSLSSLVDCYIWTTYVKGRERVQYRNGDEEGSFEIDYGNGDCDNIVWIFENGKICIVDLSKRWYAW